MSDQIVSSLSPLSAAQRHDQELEQVHKAARQFEALFVGEVFKAMRKTVGGEHDFGHQMYTEMFDEKLSEHIASSGIGLAQALIEELAPAEKSVQERLAAVDK